jgi:hypothetical protein
MPSFVPKIPTDTINVLPSRCIGRADEPIVPKLDFDSPQRVAHSDESIISLKFLEKRQKMIVFLLG